MSAWFGSLARSQGFFAAPRRRVPLLRLAMLLTVLLVAMFVLTGCGVLPNLRLTRGSREAGEANRDWSKPVALRDDAGRTVVVKKRPKRFVSLAPANTEILFALGLGEQVVGVTTYCDYPPEAKKKEKVGDFANPNIEKIISLRPDLVLATSGIQGPVVERLDKAGVPVVVVDPKSVDALLEDLRRIGILAGRRAEAMRLIADMNKRVAAVRTKLATAESHPRVFYEVYSEPLMTVGALGVVNELITIAGGRNVAGDIRKDFPQFGLETLIQKDPEVYIASTGSMATPDAISKRAGWQRLSAVRAGRVHVIDENILNRPGPRLVDGLEELARLIHPEIEWGK